MTNRYNEDINEDTLLWNAVQKGDEKSYAIMYSTYAKSMYRYGFRYTQKIEEIEDAIHDVFVNIYSNHKKLPLVTNVKAYLLISMRNRLINSVQKKDAPFDTTSFDSLNIASDHNIEDEYIREENQQGHKQLFAQLSQQLTAKEKEAIYLRYVEQLPYKDIAEVLMIQVQSAKNIIRKSIRKMRDNLAFIALLLIILYYNT